MKFSFLHAADLHLDSPFSTYSNLPTTLKDALLNAPFKALQKLVNFAIKDRTSFLCLSGDIFDSMELGLRAQTRFLMEIERLYKAGIKVFICFGNHDPLGSSSLSVNLPKNCFVFPSENLESFDIEPITGVRCKISGISYKRRDEKRNLSRLFGKLTPKQDQFSIGMLHTNCGGISSHYNYAPCTLNDLKGAPIDYWALGHIHKMTILSDSNPFVGYPGVIQGRSFKETGPKGCFRVQVEGQKVKVEFIPLDTIRWTVTECVLSQEKTKEEIFETISRVLNSFLNNMPDQSPLHIVRVVLSGKAFLKETIYKEDLLFDIKEALNDIFFSVNTGLWIDEIVDKTTCPMDIEELKIGTDLVAEILRTMDHVQKDNETLEQLRKVLDPIYRRREISRFLSPPGEEEFLTLLNEARDLLLELFEPKSCTAKETNLDSF
ncbi:DNA repair exonuclease family protein YhaO [Dissulfuribacter thermophilus]|uniref:DNA repair exonuclease family protein YhaO n=1 Tax=Dissulfuribacter thermophilus TaxID=1156395 RepID=A0A1B9F858_9BACT|nr:DNA repair exonuclease [Dissulfuribacter thermophilus]OCC16102.1 DNA repair exonuclease family protein YhaO [Dissulfuribacter thermophilus]